MKTIRQSRLAKRIERFVDALANGSTQYEAIKLITPNWRKMTRQQLDSRAYQFSSRPEVRDRYRSVLASTPPEKIMNQAEWGKRMTEVLEISVEKENYTAFAAIGRLIGQYNGAIKDMQINVNNVQQDKDLIRQLAGDDPAKQAAAAVLLGKSSFESDTIGPERTETETKH